jgi:hypothetical protein
VNRKGHEEDEDKTASGRRIAMLMRQAPAILAIPVAAMKFGLLGVGHRMTIDPGSVDPDPMRRCLLRVVAEITDWSAIVGAQA